MAKSITGIEIDGGHVRVARVNGSDVDYEEFEAATTGEVIDQWLKSSKPKGEFVVSWSGRSVMREATVPACPDSVLPAVFMDVAPDVMATEGHIVGGVISGEPAPDGTRAALIGGVEAEHLSSVFKKLGKSAPVILSTFAYSHDGVYLAVRAGNAEMTLVQSRRVVATRFLNIDGIDTLSASISSGGDPSAKIDAYADDLVNEVRETQRTWARSDRFDATATTIYIHGLGADLPGLREKITGITGLRVAEPPVEGLSLGNMNGQAHKAYQAIVAATSEVVDRPGVALRSPAAEKAAKEKATKEKKRSLLTISLVAAAVVIVAMAAPVVLAQRNLKSAESDYNSAVTDFNSLQQFDILGHQAQEFEQAASGIDGDEPNWPNLVSYLQERAPVGTEFADLTASFASGRQVQVEIAATVQAGPFIGPAEWLTTLLEQEGIPYAWIDSSSVADESTGTVAVQIKMQLPDDTRFFYLSDNEFSAGGESDESDDAEPATETTPEEGQ